MFNINHCTVTALLINRLASSRLADTDILNLVAKVDQANSMR